MSDHTRRLIDEEQQYLTDLAHRRATQLVAENRPLLEALASTLLENEVLERDDIERLVAAHRAARAGRSNGGREPPSPGPARRCAGGRAADARTPVAILLARVRAHRPHRRGRGATSTRPIALYPSASGCRCSTARPSRSRAWRPCCSGVGESHVELLGRSGRTRPSARFLERNGPGLHHVAYGTDDIESALEQVRAAGLR